MNVQHYLFICIFFKQDSQLRNYQKYREKNYTGFIEFFL